MPAAISATMIAATTPVDGWIDAPVFDANCHVVHDRGVTPLAGLYFLSLPWQHTRGSALLGWVKDDAEYLARPILRDGTIAVGARRRPRPFGEDRSARGALDHGRPRV